MSFFITTIILLLTIFLMIKPAFVIAAQPLWTPVPPTELVPFIVWLITTALIIGAFILVVVLIAAGLEYLTSAGNPKRLAMAKDRIIKGLTGIGLLVTFSLVLFTLNPELLEPVGLKQITPPVCFDLSFSPIKLDEEIEAHRVAYFEPLSVTKTISAIHWKIKPEGDRCGQAVRCVASSRAPEGSTTDWIGNRVHTVVDVYPYYHKSPIIITNPQVGAYTFYLRCYNAEGFGETRRIVLELRQKTIYYRIPTGKIIEWAIFDYNARKRFEKILYFVQSGRRESRELKTASEELINFIIANSTCGISRCRAIDDCCVPNPRDMYVDRRPCGRAHTVDGLDEELITTYCEVVCAPSGGKLAEIIGYLNTGKNGVEGILLAPQDPGRNFMPFKERRGEFFNQPYPINKLANLGGTPARISVVFPPDPNVENHSGAFNHWRTGDNRKWLNLLVEKRKIEAARTEIENYMNSLQLAAYLMSIGCKYQPEHLITHNQLLPPIARDPIYDPARPADDRIVEVIEIIKEHRGVIVTDLINWQLAETAVVDFIGPYIVGRRQVDGRPIDGQRQYRCRVADGKMKAEQRMAVVDTVLNFGNIFPPPRRLFLPDPLQWRTITCEKAATIFQYDPFTLYCPQYYDIGKIINLINERYKITDIQFRPNPSPTSNSTPTLITNNQQPTTNNKQQTASNKQRTTHNQQLKAVLSTPAIPLLTMGDNKQPLSVFVSAAEDTPAPKGNIYVGDIIKRHEIPAGEAVEQAMTLLTEIERNLESITREIKKQEAAALRIVELAFMCDPRRCIPRCECVCVDNVCTCVPRPCTNPGDLDKPYDISEMKRQLNIIKASYTRTFDLNNPNSHFSIINKLIHGKEKFPETIWLFPQEMTRIEKIEALTQQTRAMFNVCPTRPRGLLYYIYEGEIRGDPVSFIEIRDKLLQGETIEGVYSIKAGPITINGVNREYNCTKHCRPPNRETKKCIDCLRDATRLCRYICLQDKTSPACLQCIPGRSLLNYFCYFE